jgi:tRNA (guanine37-N1)-methyltransferase
MRFDIFTLFPQMFQGPFTESILKRAVEAGLLELHVHNIRDYTTDKHHVCDDYPYGGGAGMVMKPEPVFAAVEAVLGPLAGQQPGDAELGDPTPESAAVPVILLTPQGRLFTQAVARELAGQPRLALICGHYEGVDERIRQHLVTDEISLGDYVLTGGELPAMVLVDAVARLAPGVLDGESTLQESHAEGLLEYPQYTRPPDFRGWRVPDMLISGHHGRIAVWRRQQSLLRTLHRRPELLAKAPLTERDRVFLKDLETEEVTDGLGIEN